MIYVNITNFILISELKKNHSMIETGCLKMLFFPNDCKFCAIKEIYNKTSTAAVDP